MGGPPLAGVRVLDMTRLLPGPMCTLYLADLGADVIKVEDTGAGDYARSLAQQPGAPRHGMTAWYRALNRNKRSLAIDLKSASGHEAFMTLATTADVIVEGFRPGVVASLGVDYDAVRAINPKIVYCALSGYGQTGPRAAAAGHDINYLGYAGTLHCTGERGGAPALANLQIADLLGGAASAAIGILAALFGAARSGRGRFVDVAMADAVFAHQVFMLGALEDAGARRAARRRPVDGRRPLLWRLSRRATGDGLPSERWKRSSGVRSAMRSNGRTSWRRSSRWERKAMRRARRSSGSSAPRRFPSGAAVLRMSIAA